MLFWIEVCSENRPILPEPNEVFFSLHHRLLCDSPRGGGGGGGGGTQGCERPRSREVVFAHVSSFFSPPIKAPSALQPAALLPVIFDRE